MTPTTNEDILSLETVFNLFESMTGMEISIYPAKSGKTDRLPSINELPFKYRRHMSNFCRTVKNNKRGKGCGGYDSSFLIKKASEIGRVFVNICHAGVAEVIIPLYGINNAHIANIHLGQAVTEEIENTGVEKILKRTEHLGVDIHALQKAYLELPRMKKDTLLNYGKLFNITIKGIIESIGLENFELEIKLRNYPFIAKAIKLINNNYESNYISETWIAEQLGISPAYFCRLFKKVMNCTFSHYLLTRRISRAANLLHKTSFTITEIAHLCGYSRDSYFAKKFRQATGMSPLEYRKNKKIRTKILSS